MLIVIDATNLYRSQAILRFTADAAAHAGASALARGETAEAAEAAALKIAAVNLSVDPESLRTDPAIVVRSMSYDPDNGTLSDLDSGSSANAVLVKLRQSRSGRIAISSYVLALLGLDSRTAGGSSMATVTPTFRCSNTTGLFAHGPIKIGVSGSTALPTDGICVHSQQALVLPMGGNPNSSVPSLSLPSREACRGAGCMGITEVNLIMTDTAAYVARLAAGFADPRSSFVEKTAFFATRPIAQDLEPLAEVGVDVRGLQTGDVVELSAFRFRLLRAYPPGLVYLVLCQQPGAEVETGGEDEIIVGEWAESPPLRDIALVTSCTIRLGDHTRIEGALVISTADETGLSAAEPGARIGDPSGRCDARLRSMVMTTGNLTLPSQLTMSNIAVVVGGDVDLGPALGASNSIARGISVQAGGEIRVDGSQIFQPCPGATDKVLPPLRVISVQLPPSTAG
ncbi:MAG: hypothetical protein MUE52_04060 [Tabrizicola sp.]|jgi:hypothetical protein|nr:hypothetical protein [Tabrizicola sp.]